MMKRSLAILWIAVLCLGLLVYALLDSPRTGTVDVGSEVTEDAPETELPYIRLYATDDAWEEILAGYSGITGIGAEIVSDPQTATVMLLDSAEEVSRWGDRCADLAGTAAYAQLGSWDLVVKAEGKVCGIASRIECFGLVCNTQLLAGSAYSLSEIDSFGKLEEAVEAIAADGRTAFATPDLETFAGMVASIPYDQRAFVDLYLDNMVTPAADWTTVEPGNGAEQMRQGEAVFCLGTTEQDALPEGGSAGIGPVLLGLEGEENQTLCAVGSGYLCVRSDVSKTQILAAQAFLDYLVLPREDGTVPLDALETLSPFCQATYAANVLEKTLHRDLSIGENCLACVAMESLPEGLADALLTYALGPNDQNWKAFRALCGGGS